MKIKLTPLSTITELKSVLFIDNNDMDNFVNHKLLEIYGVKEIMSFRSPNKALAYLIETNIFYQLILVEIYLPISNGFEFIDMIHALDLHKKHGEICLLSASLDPFHRQKSAEKNIKFIDKPFSMEKLLLSR